MTATDTTTRARELAQQLSNAVRAERKAALEWGGLPVTPGSAFVDVYGETIADTLTALSDENAKLRAFPARHQVFAWLGYWRDHMPAEAVSALQDVLGPLEPAS